MLPAHGLSLSFPGCGSTVHPLPGACGPPAAPRALSELPFSVCCLTGAICESAYSPVQVACQPPATPCALPELLFCCLKGAGPRSTCSPVQVARQPPCTHAPGARDLSLLSRGCRPRVCLLPHAGGSPTASRPARAPGAPVLLSQACGSAPPCRWLPLPGALTRRLPPPSV